MPQRSHLTPHLKSAFSKLGNAFSIHRGSAKTSQANLAAPFDANSSHTSLQSGPSDSSESSSHIDCLRSIPIIITEPLATHGAVTSRDVLEEQRSTNRDSSQPDSIIGVDSSVRRPASSISLARQLPVDVSPGQVPGSLSAGPQIHQTTHRGLMLEGTGNSFVGSYIAGDNLNNTVNNIYFDDGLGSDSDLEGLRVLTGSQPNFLRIVCVTIACCLPPSVIWISCVLGLPEEEVHQSIEALAKHLQKQVFFDDKIKFPDDFVLKMYRSCVQIVGGAHGDIACWCLRDALSKPRYV
ncbi:hypothetical protein B0H12DRAFT_1134364 [Mycena haematopus]|nr:hypothetical protein B0H12DRAFT_1134364 [Mycena haematopus]